jgi:cyclopropane fatty-acyl-phospholipid synthase-like methyltransferase
MEFKANNKVYILDENIRNNVKAGWQEMLNPAKSRVLKPNPYIFVPSITAAENLLATYDQNLIFKNILEVGCNEGARCYLMAKYQDTYVHGIDVDQYTADQSPDLNAWNPKDMEFVHNNFNSMREHIAGYFPLSVKNKVTFETCDIADFVPEGKYDLIISWDTIEHIINLPKAFHVMASCLHREGILYHEYNPFFSVNGGHSLCTLDFLYGHCRLTKEDFERYVKEIRQEEEKIDLNFYNKCLNRASMADVRKYAEEAGFEIIHFSGFSNFRLNTPVWGNKLNEILPEVQSIYPSVTMEDLLYDSMQLIMRKK